MKQTVRFYPYIQPDGSVNFYHFHNDDVLFGVCAVDEDSPIVVEVDVPFTMPANKTEVVIAAFDNQISKVRAEAQVKVENIENEKQRYLAITCDNT